MFYYELRHKKRGNGMQFNERDTTLGSIWSFDSLDERNKYLQILNKKIGHEPLSEYPLRPQNDKIIEDFTTGYKKDILTTFRTENGVKSTTKMSSSTGFSNETLAALNLARQKSQKLDKSKSDDGKPTPIPTGFRC